MAFVCLKFVYRESTIETLCVCVKERERERGREEEESGHVCEGRQGWVID